MDHDICFSAYKANRTRRSRAVRGVRDIRTRSGTRLRLILGFPAPKAKLWAVRMSHRCFWRGPQEPPMCFLSSSAEFSLCIVYADHFELVFLAQSELSPPKISCTKRSSCSSLDHRMPLTAFSQGSCYDARASSKSSG